MHSLSCLTSCTESLKHRRLTKRDAISGCGEDVSSKLLKKPASVSTLKARFESTDSSLEKRSTGSVRLSRQRFVTADRAHDQKINTKQLTDLKNQLDELALEVNSTNIRDKGDRLDKTPLRPSRANKQSQRTHLDCHHLITAAREGNLEVVQWLLAKDVDPNAKDSKGRSALLVAASTDKLGTFRCLLKVSDTLKADYNGWNALHIGAVAGHLRIVEECIDSIPIDLRSRGGLTPLCLAVNRGHLDVVEYLLKKGANIQIGCNKGWNVLHFAARGKHDTILYVLLNIYGSKCRELLNDQNIEGMTPVALAVLSNSVECVRQLLDFGADPDIPDNRGWTSARIAAINNYRDVSQYLARYKAEM